MEFFTATFILDRGGKPLTEISGDKLKWLESLLYEHDTYRRQIAIRKYELNERAENGTPEIQKQPSTVSQIENFVIRMDSDPRLNNLIKRKSAIDYLFGVLGDSEQHADLYKMAIIHFKECPYNSWQNTAEAICVSKSQVYRMRYTFLEMLAKLLGEV